jgi:ankyrin repeat protein
MDVLERLLAARADIDKTRTDDGATPLCLAALDGQVHVVERLIAAGAAINKTRTDNCGNSLSIALQEGHADVVRLLRAAGATKPVFHVVTRRIRR